MTQPTQVVIDQHWRVNRFDLLDATNYSIVRNKHVVAELVNDGGTWSCKIRPRRDDPAIPFAVLAAVPHNEGDLRGLLYN
jgi:hypothetical protein